MSSFYQQNKYWIMGVGVIAMGAGLYLLSRDDEEVQVVYDPAVHTVEKLREIIHEIFLEGATLYCQKLRLIREHKKDGEFRGRETIDKLVEKQRQEMKEAE